MSPLPWPAFGFSFRMRSPEGHPPLGSHLLRRASWSPIQSRPICKSAQTKSGITGALCPRRRNQKPTCPKSTSPRIQFDRIPGGLQHPRHSSRLPSRNIFGFLESIFSAGGVLSRLAPASGSSSARPPPALRGSSAACRQGCSTREIAPADPLHLHRRFHRWPVSQLQLISISRRALLNACSPMQST